MLHGHWEQGKTQVEEGLLVIRGDNFLVFRGLMFRNCAAFLVGLILREGATTLRSLLYGVCGRMG